MKQLFVQLLLMQDPIWILHIQIDLKLNMYYITTLLDIRRCTLQKGFFPWTRVHQVGTGNRIDLIRVEKFLSQADSTTGIRILFRV